MWKTKPCPLSTKIAEGVCEMDLAIQLMLRVEREAELRMRSTMALRDNFVEDDESSCASKCEERLQPRFEPACGAACCECA